MTEAMPPVDPESLDFDDLEPLEELPEIEELDELEPLEPEPAKPKPSSAKPKPSSAKPKPVAKAKPPAPKPVAKATPPAPKPAAPKPEAPLAEEATPAAAPAAAAPAPGPSAPGEFQLRELDKAPDHLRKAALIATAGSLFPWLGHGGGMLTNVAAKALIFVGMGLIYLYWKYRGGEDVPSIFAKLSDIGLVPKKKDEDEKKPRRRQEAQVDASAFLRGAKFPAAIHVLAFAVLIGAVMLPSFEEGTDLGAASAELGMLAWGVAAWVHIYAYQRWSKFNPIFPLMFLGHAFAGVLGVVKGLGEGGTPWMIAGGALVAAGGFFAAWTIIEALRAAKAEGDAKKAAAAEARRAARKARS